VSRKAQYRLVMEMPLQTSRLSIRDWSVDDADAATSVYGAPEVTQWLTPVMEQVHDTAAMRSVLQAWGEAQPNQLPPAGRWAIERHSDRAVIGGLAIRLLPPYEEDLELSWQLSPDAWGNGYAVEAGRALTEWAFTKDIDELFAVVRPDNTRAIATAERIGMSWVGETDKFYDQNLHVYRVRPADLLE